KNADKKSIGLETYQNLLLNCKQFQTTVLPFRDGLALSYRIF
ncbi:O-methyltransferase, partial [bacterium]|nr:O-methyltransferase [bacterium]